MRLLGHQILATKDECKRIKIKQLKRVAKWNSCCIYCRSFPNMGYLFAIKKSYTFKKINFNHTRCQAPHPNLAPLPAPPAETEKRKFVKKKDRVQYSQKAYPICLTAKASILQKTKPEEHFDHFVKKKRSSPFFLLVTFTETYCVEQTIAYGGP